jgi:hypothetical protein
MIDLDSVCALTNMLGFKKSIRDMSITLNSMSFDGNEFLVNLSKNLLEITELKTLELDFRYLITNYYNQKLLKFFSFTFFNKDIINSFIKSINKLNQIEKFNINFWYDFNLRNKYKQIINNLIFSISSCDL